MTPTLSRCKRAVAFHATPEGRLILAVASNRLDPKTIDPLVEAGLDWSEILQRAIASDLAPLLYHRIKRLQAAPLVPELVMRRLKDLYQWHLARNMNLYLKLKELRDVFDAENIPVIVLKGAVLADLVYGDIGLRIMRDLDILVRKSDFDRADDRLQRMGYTPNDSYDWNRQFHHNVPYVSGDRSLTLELHHHIVPPGAPVNIPADDLWKDAQPIQITNHPARSLSREKLLLHLCMHLAYDDRFYRSLRSLTDIAATISFYQIEIDWMKFLAHVRAYSADRSAYYALWLTEHLLHAEVPTAVLKKLGDRRGNSALNNFALKVLIQRSILSTGSQGSMIPAWVVKGICGDLVVSGKISESVKALLERFPPRYVLNKVSRAVGHKN